MSSPEPPVLDYIPGGTIWDGVTEYLDSMPEGVILYACRMYQDGTRRFSETFGMVQPMEDMGNLISRNGWESIGIAVESPYTYQVDYRQGAFLGYDGLFSFDPPNQHYQIQLFREHASRFAHELDESQSLHTLQGGDEWKRLTIHQTLSAMIAVAARRYNEWEAIDPEELISGGTYDGTLLWKRNEADYIATDVTLCGQCDISTFARRFWFEADLNAFRRVWRQGIIYSADRTATPWAPEIFDVVLPPYEDAYDELDALYLSMVKHYDLVVGAQDHS